MGRVVLCSIVSSVAQHVCVLSVVGRCDCCRATHVRYCPKTSNSVQHTLSCVCSACEGRPDKQRTRLALAN